jgi:DNA-binding NtrC family response regulator
MPPHQSRVLLVDDESGLRFSLAANLELAGLEVVEADSGARALELAAAQPFDLVLTDVRMPGMSGLELFMHLRARGSDVPVIVMTAFAGEAVIEEAIDNGAFTILPKPFDADEIVPILLTAMRRPVVLVIDDQEPQASTAAAALVASGVRAAAAFDGESAIRMVAGGDVDVCIVDLVMPDVSGPALMAQIQASDPSIILIAMSGRSVPDLMRAAAAAGARAVLQKPVPIPELARVIASARGRPRR